MQEEEFNVNVRKILATKAPKSKVPEFLIRYLEKIAHQDEINEFLSRKGHLHGIEFLEESIKFIGIELNVYGIDKIPEGRYTFAGNHPMGGVDGMSAGFEVYKKFPERNIMFLSNDILSTIINLHPLFVPVNKVGKMKQDRSLPQRVDEVYQSDRQMVIFPAGKCARRQNGKITEQKWSKSFIQKSIETQRDIVPLYFEGQNSNFFYNLANIRSFFGIKTNIEMLFLVDEMFKQRGKTFNVIFGDPVSYKYFDNSRTAQEWADWVRSESLKLSNNLKNYNAKHY
jgi:putative hemolysin